MFVHWGMAQVVRIMRNNKFYLKVKIIEQTFRIDVEWRVCTPHIPPGQTVTTVDKNLETGLFCRCGSFSLRQVALQRERVQQG